MLESTLLDLAIQNILRQVLLVGQEGYIKLITTGATSGARSVHYSRDSGHQSALKRPYSLYGML